MMHSPLRYPGGKYDFLSVAQNIFRDTGLAGSHVIEPYAGSAAVSLGLLDSGLASHVTLCERDPLLYCFWKAVFERTSELVVQFQDLPITLDTWARFQPYLLLDKPDEARVVECGLAALFFNRANFSGILNAGPIGGQQQASAYKIDCRTNKDDIIGRILALAMLAEGVSVKFGDAVDLIRSMQNESKAFFYLDPPYFNKGELLYRHYYKLKQHKQLAAALAESKFRWLLSYDDHPVIEFLYQQFNVIKQDFRYSVHSPKQRSELLISNFPIGDLGYADKALPRRPRQWSALRSSSDVAEAVL